jgi:hypothetical protein
MEAAALVYRFFKVADEQTSLERLRQVVEQHTLWASAPKRFNDPFEFKFLLSCDGDESELRNRYFQDNPNKSDEDYISWSNDIKRPNGMWHINVLIREKFLNRLGLLCFTKTPQNLLMWSHYGPDHSSFCAAFEYGTLAGMDHRFTSGPVCYSNEPLKFNYLKDDKQALARIAFFNKAEAWAYEQEVRVICKTQGLVPYPIGALKGIILGCRAYKALRTYANENLGNGIFWRQMIEKYGKYEIEEAPIEKNVVHMSSHF